MTQPLHLQIDVSPALPYAAQHISASVYLPRIEDLLERPIVLFASPGGGYSRHYYDMKFEGRTGYSEARFHVDHGFIFVSYEHLGVGESSTDQLFEYTRDQLTAANDAAVREIARRLREGSLQSGFPALPDFCMLGLGQSMGGHLTICMQGHHATFDGIAPLGYSAIHTVLPQPDDAVRLRGIELHKDVASGQVSREQAFEALDYVYPFHWEDVPEDILQVDMAGGYPIRRTSPVFGSLTLPPCAAQMMTPGVVKTEAAAVTVPVLIAVGERDVCPVPHQEPSAFSGSDDVSLVVVPRMAHMHNFAGTRELLWRRIEVWAQQVANPVGK